MRHGIDEIRHGRAALAQKRKRATEEHRKQQHLQHVAIGKCADGGVWDQFHQELNGATAGEFAGILGIGAHRLHVQRFGIDVHADTRLEPEGQRQTER